MTVQIVVYLSTYADSKEHFTYLNDELGRKEYGALARAFRDLVSMQAEERFHKLTMEAGSEWVVRLDALHAIELRIFDEGSLQHQIAVEVALAKRRNRVDKVVKEQTAGAVGFR